jgi:hypothetical protein
MGARRHLRRFTFGGRLGLLSFWTSAHQSPVDVRVATGDEAEWSPSWHANEAANRIARGRTFVPSAANHAGHRYRPYATNIA